MTQNNPKILVTICNYNHSKYLEQSIKSIQAQTYSNLDICVVDDGSSDIDKVIDIVETLKSEDKRIRFINLKKNYGKWFSLNAAIETSDAFICTSHDADDISLKDRIDMQLFAMNKTNTVHNLCGFHHCWKEEDIEEHINDLIDTQNVRVVGPEPVKKMVFEGFKHPRINHYFTGNFETAGVSAMFLRELWSAGLRFNPPGIGLRVLLSEDSDFNFRCTMLTSSTSILAEKPYLYRRNTGTNQEQY